MYIQNNVPLSAYSTMRLGGSAAYLTEITDKFKVGEAVTWALERSLPFIVIGHGSNIVWKDEGFEGLVIVNKIKGFELYQQDDDITYVSAGAGEEWDSVVERSVEAGLSGIETLSLIPGTTGATPVQNVGAYGTEMSDVLMTVEAYDAKQNELVTLRASDCSFSYRSSMFKTTERGRYIITGIIMRLTKQPMKPPFYSSLQDYLTEQNTTDYSPIAIRNAVIEIRRRKLPDPAVTPNNGSFFKNPIVPYTQIKRLLEFYPTLAYWEIDASNVKVSAAWLLEQVGYKGVHDENTGMATWENQPLVLVNEHASSTNDLLAFKTKIIEAVQQKFQITLEQEPELLPE